MATYEESLNLFLQGPVPVETEASLDLSLVGNSEGTTHVFDSLPLFLEGEAFGEILNLYLFGGEVETETEDSLHLFLVGGGIAVEASLDLYTSGSNVIYALSYNPLTLDQYSQLTL